MDYEWDIAKAAANLRKHGIDFADAIPAVEDPNRLERTDIEVVSGEERTRVVGVAKGRVLFVITTWRGEGICRIISARRAERHEQDQYYSRDTETW